MRRQQSIGLLRSVIRRTAHFLLDQRMHTASCVLERTAFKLPDLAQVGIRLFLFLARTLGTAFFLCLVSFAALALEGDGTGVER